jgi:transposase
MLEHPPHGFILVWDRWQVRCSVARRLLRRFPHRLQIERLPPQAPRLNPDEQIWTQTKYHDLANFLPQDVTDLGQAMRCSLQQTQTPQSLLRSFFNHAKLRLKNSLVYSKVNE